MFLQKFMNLIELFHHSYVRYCIGSEATISLQVTSSSRHLQTPFLIFTVFRTSNFIELRHATFNVHVISRIVSPLHLGSYTDKFSMSFMLCNSLTFEMEPEIL
jgi:hypothetical protein